MNGLILMFFEVFRQPGNLPCQFTLMKIPLWFFDPYDTVSMEAALQEMAENAQERKKQIPQADVLRQAGYRERGRELYQGIKDMIWGG